MSKTDSRPAKRPSDRPLRALIALVIALGAYFLVYRPLQIDWGATDKEITRSLPGDEIVERPMFNATRAMTIAAAPGEVWPWIVQIGHTRAGWYSYDVVDNLARESARRIIPELQRVAPGDLVPVSPDGKQGFYVKAFETNKWMLWWDRQGGLSIVWALYPLDSNSTRLITRIRFRYHWASFGALLGAVLDAGDFVMMRQAMAGIRDRAEGKTIRSFISHTLELLLWIVCFVGFVIADIRLIKRDDWLFSTSVAVASALITIVLVIWQPPPWIALLGAAGIVTTLIRTKT